MTARAVELMQGETRCRDGRAPESIGGVRVLPGRCWLAGDEFLLRDTHGIGMYYRKGEGVTIERPCDVDERDVALWFNGSLHAAIAIINGLLPLHASAVAHDGRVHAFAGPSGAGKSTLVAALGALGLPLFCDDTLIIDPAGEGPPFCLPGHKRLKLWPDAAPLAQASLQERVASHLPKHFAEPSGGTDIRTLPLGQLLILDHAETPAITKLGGGERVFALLSDQVTHDFPDATPPAMRFARAAGLARRIPMARLSRPFDAARFQEGMDFIFRHVTGTLQP